MTNKTTTKVKGMPLSTRSAPGWANVSWWQSMFRWSA